MLTPGTLLGERYEIIEKIGAGGMSVVYKAKDTRLQRFVAIKELREEFVQDEEFVIKFRKEALSAASLSHPNIVGIYDVGSDHEIHYIVMEYVEGKTLKQVIAEDGPFDAKTVLELGAQMVSALKHAHQKKIIHRDIKPQNILMTHDGTLKVTDFGIAKAVDSSTIVATGNAIGSVHYFSPEQAKGKYVNESSDLYSCGIVLFELATKKLPFEADSHISIALKHINEEIPKPSSINPEIPENLENLILKATSKNQVDRYLNADVMLRDMRGILQNPNYVVKNNTLAERTILLSASETQLLRDGDKEMHYRGNSQDFESNQEQEKVTGETSIFETEAPNEPEKEEVSTFYKVLVSIGGVLATLALVVIITLACVNWLPSLSKSYSVPNVINMALEEAQQTLKDNNLRERIIQIVSDEVAPGTVLEQSPVAGTAVKKNTVIELSVAVASDENGGDTAQGDSEMIEIPDVSKMASDKAQEILERAGLFVKDITSEYSDEVMEGMVMSQIPVAGGKVAKGTGITLVISKGQEKAAMTTVPNLIGQTVEEATASLEASKLSMGKQKEEYSDRYEAGVIMRQGVSAGTSVEEGSTVGITVSKGPEEKQEETPAPSEQPGEPNNSETNPEEPKTLSHTVNLPTQTDVKESYHVLVKLVLDNGTEQTVCDENVPFDSFPKTVSFTGTGSGILYVYIDGQGYQENVTF